MLQLFRSFSPIEDFTGKWKLELLDYVLGDPKYTVEECRDRDMTYEAPIKARVRLRSAGKEVIESPDVYLGDLPLMTERGTFLINGAERVVVSQLARSPGIYFKETMDYSGRVLYFATMIPSEGAWVEVESDQNDCVWVRIGQTRKFPITTLIRAMQVYDHGLPGLPREVPAAALETTFKEWKEQSDGIGVITINEAVADPKTGEVIADVGAFLDSALAGKIMDAMGVKRTSRSSRAKSDVTIKLLVPPPPCHTDEQFVRRYGGEKTLRNPELEDLIGKFTAEPIVDAKGKVILPALKRIEKDHLKALAPLSLKKIKVHVVNEYISGTMAQDPTHDRIEALRDVYKKIRPGDPVTEEGAKSLLRSIFFDPRRYDLARVGRYKVNKKLGYRVRLDSRHVTAIDLLGIVEYMIKLHRGEGQIDDIDHLENKRVRSVGELLQSQLRTGFQRMEKVAKERMTSLDAENMLPQVVLSVKPISASIKSFFGSSQLSQFMDQTNPLAELTHKRRLSALGPGGLSRQSAKLEVRDVHHSHYGRICPIETPEGPNIGLVGSLAVHARINEFGFIETPYYTAKKGVVDTDPDRVVYLTADDDDAYRIAPADTPIDAKGRFLQDQVIVRYQNTYPVVEPEQVEFMDVSPDQLVSVATALIPFLENDDANRALMGSNMQRQAVPLLRSEPAIVKTGIEERVAQDSGAVVLARRKGIVRSATCERIIVETFTGETDTYKLAHTLRSNQATCITQKPVVTKGALVQPGDVLADGPSSINGELALGRNLLVAFLPWHGYNYEDAILISERLVRDDSLSSIHIEKYESEARDTKLGPEEITRDIPNVSEDMLKDLDEDGIVRIGAEVRAEDILVGKVAPKGQGELTAEERLIIAIFGKKAEETRDVSLRVPHGEKGTVIDVKVFSRFKYSCLSCGHVKNYSKKPDSLICERCSGELIRLAGDELAAGVNQMVRVYVAQKRKVMEGDKMAGRHGNKGVISKIVPQADLPFLPDGTPVDVVLNPLGVPSRMNIGQILETHLGFAGRVLDREYTNPIFKGAKEPEILGEILEVVGSLRLDRLTDYIERELKVALKLDGDETCGQVLERLRGYVEAAEPKELKRLARILGIRGEAVDWMFEEDGGPDTFQIGTAARFDADADRPPKPDLDGYDEFVPDKGIKKRQKAVVEEIQSAVQDNVWLRVGFDDESAKCELIDGLSGERLNQPATVGYLYLMKLAHLVDDKIHARSTGPYSLVTQQPLGGKAQFGGQRFGEMEVWALEAYGAAHTLQEILTIKSDDVQGRVKTYESIVKGEAMLEPGVPESFKILANELMSLGLKVTVMDDRGDEVSLKDHDVEAGEPERRIPRDIPRQSSVFQ
jgi:DNA-directed RNA polymerase subunit beta